MLQITHASHLERVALLGFVVTWVFIYIHTDTDANRSWSWYLS